MLAGYAATLLRLTDLHDHPALAQALAAGALDTDDFSDELAFGLERLLDGVEALVGRSGRRPATGQGVP